jgi:hypothetical protein
MCSVNTCSPVKQPSLIWYWIWRMIYCGMTRFILRVVNKNNKYIKTFTYIFSLTIYDQILISGFVAKHFYLHILQIERQCFLISVYKKDCATVCCLPRFNVVEQTQIKSYVNTLSPPKRELFRFWTKCIGVRAVALHCHNFF